MRTLDGLDPDVALAALSRLAGHVPPEVEIGRPLVAQRDPDGCSVMFATTAAWWWAFGDRAERMIELRDGLAEATTYRDGREITRVVDRVFESG